MSSKDHIELLVKALALRIEMNWNFVINQEIVVVKRRAFEPKRTHDES